VPVAPIKEKRLNYPNNELWRNVHYRPGYEHKAQQIKGKKVWSALDVGLLISSVFYCFVFKKDLP